MILRLVRDDVSMGARMMRITGSRAEEELSILVIHVGLGLPSIVFWRERWP